MEGGGRCLRQELESRRTDAEGKRKRLTAEGRQALEDLLCFYRSSLVPMCCPEAEIKGGRIPAFCPMVVSELLENDGVEVFLSPEETELESLLVMEVDGAGESLEQELEVQELEVICEVVSSEVMRQAGVDSTDAKEDVVRAVERILDKVE